MDHYEHIIKRLTFLRFRISNNKGVSFEDAVENVACTWKKVDNDKTSYGYSATNVREEFDTLALAQEAMINYLIETCAKEIADQTVIPETDSSILDNFLRTLEKIVIDLHYVPAEENEESHF